MTGDSLPVPSIPAPGTLLPVEEVASFLKLILGVAVTCSNKVLFISKIQSLDETTQHALTACIVSFISTKVRQDKTKIFGGKDEGLGRFSGYFLTSILGFRER